MDELKAQSSYVLDPAILKLLSSVDEGKVTLSPTSMMESLDGLGRKKVPEKRRESELMERKKDQGERSLEEQMLEQSSYHKHGQPDIVHTGVFVQCE